MFVTFLVEKVKFSGCYFWNKYEWTYIKNIRKHILMVLKPRAKVRLIRFNITILKLNFDTISVEGQKSKDFFLIPQLRFTIKE